MLAAQQVIDAVAARLNGLPLAGARVFTSRTWPLTEKDLPAWRLFAVDEDIEPQTIHEPSVQMHRLQIELRGHARATDDLDDRLNDLASEALGALFANPPPSDTLSTLRQKVSLSARRIERGMQTEGEASVGIANITVRAEFMTRSDAPDTIL